MAPEFQLGDRVVTTRTIDRYPHFNIGPPVQGTVVEPPEKGGFAVRLDEVREELDDWANEIHWYPGDDWGQDIQPLDEVAPMNQETRPLGYCTVCIRVRWLERVTGVDRLNNPQGICGTCTKEEGGEDKIEIVTLNEDWVRSCPHTIMDPRHYEDYEQYDNCRCYDPDDDLMVDWGYTWNDEMEVWE